jgi:hypothetical protein
VAAIVVHIQQAAYELFVGIMTQTAGWTAPPTARRALRHSRPALGIFAHQDVRLLNQILVAVSPLHACHRLQPLAKNRVRIGTAPSAKRAARGVSRARRDAIPVHYIVVQRLR